jgi:hypothetical protein
MKRRYYSIRTGKNRLGSQLDLPELLLLFKVLFLKFERIDYFQEAFGYDCVDAGEVSGTLGFNINSQLFLKLRKQDLWPIHEKCLQYSEDDLFDIIEFLFDYISKPIDGVYHGFNDCGWHYTTFNKEKGRNEFRTEINELLVDYSGGYELSVDGEILSLAEHGLESLLQADLPIYDPNNVDNRVENAILKFRRYKSSIDDRRDAIRDLADVLEYLRPKLKLVLTKKDEGELFQIANSFGIRHHDDQQKTDYDKVIWYSWMFYYYLATIHASVRLIQRYEQNGATEGGS